ncbi:hypothetical protein QKW49_23025 [Petroclostridium sp. X23]|nr:hypothetical protein [Petroclostridium sp. X23]WHH58633.1 hypothetical protein QKW49_23025 [Petroclostridium sp. X23]
MIFLLIMVFIGIALFEVPDLIRKKYRRELIVFSLFLLLAFTMAILQTIGVEIPNPSNGIAYVVKDLLGLNYK